MRNLLTLLLLTTTYSLSAQTEDEMMVKKSFLILQSTKSYPDALKTARGAASSLAYRLDLRGLKPNIREGLTFSRPECDSNGWEYPCYVPRGRYDDGAYISIERSDAYNGFSKGYYIVIAASGEPAGKEVKGAFVKARPLYRQAYLKTAKVYMGCMH